MTWNVHATIFFFSNHKIDCYNHTYPSVIAYPFSIIFVKRDSPTESSPPTTPSS